MTTGNGKRINDFPVRSYSGKFRTNGWIRNKKTRPCLVISPNEMNKHLKTVIIAPMTTKGFPAPFRINTTFQSVSGKILLDQLHTIDKSRIVKSLGTLSRPAQQSVKNIMLQMFS